jgi:A/G-specific adenine glycosylase
MNATPGPRTIIQNFRSYLLNWGNSNIRDYPWRYQSDPYKVLVSEFMLHRTQTKQVVPIFKAFITKFPTLEEFINGDEKEVADILRSLGLTWRIAGMIGALRELWGKYSLVPDDYNSLMEIKGIGQYIAGATICFTKNEPVPIIDSNVVRVVGRVYGLVLSGEARRKKPMYEAIKATIDPENPRNFYYALIDLSHSHCRPKKPDCDSCPLLNCPCEFGVRIRGTR